MILVYRTLLLTLTAMLFSSPASAIFIESTERYAITYYLVGLLPEQADADGRTYSGPATAETVSARVTARLDQLSVPLVPAAPGYASAALGSTGHSSVMAAGYMTGSGIYRQQLLASAVEQVTAVIPSLGYHDVLYSFDLYSMFFEFWDDYGLMGNLEKIIARLRYTVELYQDATLARSQVFQAEAKAFSDSGNIVFDISTAPLLSSWEVYGESDDNFLGIRFDPVSVTDLNLGTVLWTTGDHATFTVRTAMWVELSFPEGILDVGGAAGISDPNGITIDPTAHIRLQTVDTPPAVPETGSGLLAALGLAAVLARRRRRLP